MRVRIPQKAPSPEMLGCDDAIDAVAELLLPLRDTDVATAEALIDGC